MEYKESSMCSRHDQYTIDKQECPMPRLSYTIHLVDSRLFRGRVGWLQGSIHQPILCISFIFYSTISWVPFMPSPAISGKIWVVERKRNLSIPTNIVMTGNSKVYCIFTKCLQTQQLLPPGQLSINFEQKIH